MEPKVLILYASHEINENLLFFINKGYFEDTNHQFVFIFNNPELKPILTGSNVKTIIRENDGLDFGAWSNALFTNIGENQTKYLYENYDYFIFINSTVRGPFLPAWYNENDHGRWPKLFLNKLNDQIKLVGTTINEFDTNTINVYYPHVQSMFMATDKIGLDIGIKNNVFSLHSQKMNKMEIVKNKELGYSKFVLDSGFNIGCMLYAYNGIDFRLKQNPKQQSDPCYHCGYFGFNINPYEVIFIKANKMPGDLLIRYYTQWHNGDDNILKTNGVNGMNKTNKIIKTDTNQNLSDLGVIRIKINQIKRVVYGIDENMNMDVTDKVVKFFSLNNLLSKQRNFNDIVGVDPYIGVKKKLIILKKTNEQIIVEENAEHLTRTLVCDQ